MAAVILLGYAALLVTVGAVLLRRAAWVDRAPRLGVVVWQALSVSAVLAMIFGGLALTVPTMQVSGRLSELLDACVLALRAQYATPGGAALGTVGAILAVGVLARSAYCVAATVVRDALTRRGQHRILALLGSAHAVPGVTLLDHGQPIVYCVAGRPHRIVLTTGADAVLDEAGLAAVLAHERAHLVGRHHVAVGAAQGLARAFPGVRLFRYAREEIARLVELLADDAASRSHPRLALAEAMLTLAAQAPPAGALAAGALAARGTVAAARVRRLIAGPRPFGAVRTALGMVAATAILTLPGLVLATPAAMAGPDCCAATPRPIHAAEECLTGRDDRSCQY